jgi:hypothetical protein
MPDPKDPLGSTPEPTPQPSRAEQPTTPVSSTGTPEQPPAAQPSPAAEAPQRLAPDTTAASAAEPPAGPPPTAGPGYATAPRHRFRQVAAHRATQLVAVGVLGLILGGGLVALLDRDGHRGGHGRPGFSRMDDRGAPGDFGPRGDRGRDRGWENHGRFER